MIRWAGMEILEQFAEVVDPNTRGYFCGMYQPEAIARCYNSAAMLTNTRASVAKARETASAMYSKPGPLNWKSIGAPMLRMRMKQLRIPMRIRQIGFRRAVDSDLRSRVGARQSDDIVFEKFAPMRFWEPVSNGGCANITSRHCSSPVRHIETGIDGTARDALNLGYYTVIVRDCVGSPYQDTYDAALESLERIFDVVDSSDIIREWRTARASVQPLSPQSANGWSIERSIHRSNQSIVP